MTNNHPQTIEEYCDLLGDEGGLDAQVKQIRKDLKIIQINCYDPSWMRKRVLTKLGPELGIELIQPRKTKKDGYTLQIQDSEKDNNGYPITIRFKKGGDFRSGRKNELNFQQFIRKQIQENGICHLSITDSYGKKLKLDAVDVIDEADSHGTSGEHKRSDTTLKLEDGTLYGISQKKTNATYVCKAKKLFHKMLYKWCKILREYAKNNGLKRGDYIDIRITNEDLMKLCFFGTDIAAGCVLIGDLEEIGESDEISVERIIENNDTDITKIPIYVKFLIKNTAYTMVFCGVTLPSKNGKWIVDDVKLPLINAPFDNSSSDKLNNPFVADEKPKTTRRRKKKRKARKLAAEESVLYSENRHREDLGKEIAWCAENHKLIWLKYDTVDALQRIHRKVAPYSYRTRFTNVRGKATYFYGMDFTPGEDNIIKCFLIDNLIDAKRTNTSFSPKFPIEIKMEIDRLEEKREEKERKEKEAKEIAKQSIEDSKKEDKAKEKTKDDIEELEDNIEQNEIEKEKQPLQDGEVQVTDDDGNIL